MTTPPLLTLDFTELRPPRRQPGLLGLPQDATERLLLEAVCETGMCDLRFGTPVRCSPPR